MKQYWFSFLSCVWSAVWGLVVVVTASVVVGPALGSDGGAMRRGVSLWGDFHWPADSTHLPYAYRDAPKGGQIVLGALGTFDKLNPFTLRGKSAAGLGLIYDTLLLPYAEGVAESYGLVAHSVGVTNGGRTIVFQLRPQARFHDGVLMTSADVAWSFETLTTQGSPLWRSYFAAIERVETPDDHTVMFHANTGDNRELPLILGQLPVLPRHAWQDRPFDAVNLDVPLGSGPYRVGKLVAGRSIVYERVPDYWAADLPIHRGRHNFDRIRYTYLRDANVLFEAFRAGRIDFRVENVSKNWSTGYDIDAVRDGQLIKKEFPISAGASAQSIFFNQRYEKYQDRRVREALALVFDFERINRQLMYGAYTRLNSYFDNSDLTPRETPNAAQKTLLEAAREQGSVPDEAFGEAYRQPVFSDNASRRENFARALELMAEAGYRIVDGVMLDPQNRRFEITFLLYSSLFAPHLNMYAENLQRIGVTATSRVVEPSEWLRRVRSLDFDAIIYPLAHGLSPGNELRDYWGSQAAGVEGSGNFGGVRNGAVDYLIEQVIGAQTRSQLIDAVGALDRVLTWSHASLLTYYASTQRIAYWDRFAYPTPSTIFGTSIDLWWSTEP